MSLRSVVVLNDFCHVQGGASKVAIDEAVALAGAGFEVTFIGAVGPVAPELRTAGVRVICLAQPELADRGRRRQAALIALWNASAKRATAEVLAGLDRRRTIVHLHGYTKALTATPMRAARDAGFARICTLHDFFAACPNGAFFDYRRQAPCERHALGVACVTCNCDKRHPAHKAYRVVRGASQRWAVGFPRSTTDFIALSRRSATLLAPYLPRGARLYSLANIIDAPHAVPVQVAANRHLVVVGRLDPEKGVVLAAEAARRVGLPITFVGDGPLRAAVEALGAEVTGWVPASGVWAALERARCLLFPSLWYETFGLVVEEAAARGVPAVVSDVSAPAERIVDGRTGWLFRSGDLAGLRTALEAVRDDDTIRAAGAEAYARFWSAPPDRARHTARLAEIYETVLARAVA